MAERADLIRLAVFGRPIAHSLSPEIHRRFAAQAGLAVDYRAIESSPESFPQHVRDLAATGGRGCNVTVPLKHLAWKLGGSCSSQAQQAQAANTLVLDGPGKVHADNTDGRGLVADLRQGLAKPLAGGHVLVLGAGGAAAGILGDLLHQEPARVVVANRTPERAHALASRFSSAGRVSGCGLDQLADAEAFDLVINATSLGHTGQSPAPSQDLFADASLCYDLNYGQAAEPLRKHCREHGIEFRDGLGMLVEQAALSFQLWTGFEADGRAVLQALRRV